MLLIVAHHYVVNSGLYDTIKEAPLTISSATMLLFGAWGKTGINCFVLITGYFMCRQSFSWHKLAKLYLQITFYTVVIYGIFCITGSETLSTAKIAMTLFPLQDISNGFVSCFIVFYLCIPFLNIMIKALDGKNHMRLIILTLSIYTLLPSAGIHVALNYVSWFIVLYLMASYVRFYGFLNNLSHRTWGIFSLISILTGAASIVVLFGFYKYNILSNVFPYFFISDSNKILALLIAFSSFMWFKDMRLPHSRLINTIGATTFGVLLIHGNSYVMINWLWRETVDCVGHFGDSVIWTLGYAIVSVLIVFIVCSGIDWFRGRLIEPWLTDKFIRVVNASRKLVATKLIA